MAKTDYNISTVSSACISRKICSKSTYGAAADKDGKCFEETLAKILRSGGKTDEEKSIADYFCSCLDICRDDIQYVSTKASRISNKSPRFQIKTDVIICLKKGNYLTISCKNTRSRVVGGLETSIESWKEHFNNVSSEVYNALTVYRDDCRFGITKLKTCHANEYEVLKKYFLNNSHNVMEGVLKGFGPEDRAKANYIVFNDKKLNEMCLLSVDDYIKFVSKAVTDGGIKTTQFGIPALFTRTSGNGDKPPNLKVKIYNPIKLHRKLSNLPATGA